MLGRRLKRITWAVDPFDDLAVVRRRSLGLFRYLISKMGAEGEVVYVLAPSETLLPADRAPLTPYLPAAEKALESFAESLELGDEVSCRVLAQSIGSVHSSVQLLIDHAHREGTDLILAGSHARRGLRKLFLGSFSDSLILHSDIPVVLTGPQFKEGQGLERILFPTDLGPYSRSLFEYAVLVARSLGAKMRVFHSVPYPVEPLVQSSVYLLGGGWIPLHAYLSEESDTRSKQLQAWKSWAEKRGVSVEISLLEQGGDASDYILDEAEKDRSQLILMASRSGPVSTVLVGSTTRRVVRESPCPVWIIHPPRAVRRRAA